MNFSALLDSQMFVCDLDKVNDPVILKERILQQARFYSDRMDMADQQVKEIVDYYEGHVDHLETGIGAERDRAAVWEKISTSIPGSRYPPPPPPPSW